MTVLPRRTWRDRPISDAHGSQPACDCDTIGGVTIADEVARRECFGDLSGDPFGSRMCGHVDPDETSPLQTQDHQPIEKFEPNGRNDEQINGGDVRSVNAQERSPTCRGWAAPAAHVLGNSRLGDVDTKFQQFAMNTRRAPERVILADCADQSRISLGTCGRPIRRRDFQRQ